jgi:enoyl-[acyl-carrier protein] reductase/trans-2-enoyl-CoA reductase (NAD+)
MIIKPKVRGFICTTTHPVGCKQHVMQQIQYVKSGGSFAGAKKVLVIGASTGYGLASRIVSAFANGAKTIGVFFERAGAEDRTGSAGWYNTAAFDQAAKAEGLLSININGDAFSDEIKQQTYAAIREHLGKVDLVVYSLASPRRTHPQTGETFTSVLKPIGPAYTNKTINFTSGEVSEVTIDSANDDEIAQTVAVMGGEDWAMWMEQLDAAGLLADGVKTVAYSYIGPAVTHAIYREGTIGRAKDHLEATAHAIQEKLAKYKGSAVVSVNKALVTQASSAIPIVPLYISILYKVMKEKGLHEGCIEQITRLYRDHLFATNPLPLDEKGRIRVDDWEMREDVQREVDLLWSTISSENVEHVSDLAGYRHEFMRLFGFELPDVDYEADIELSKWELSI